MTTRSLCASIERLAPVPVPTPNGPSRPTLDKQAPLHPLDSLISPLWEGDKLDKSTLFKRRFFEDLPSICRFSRLKRHFLALSPDRGSLQKQHASKINFSSADHPATVPGSTEIPHVCYSLWRGFCETNAEGGPLEPSLEGSGEARSISPLRVFPKGVVSHWRRSVNRQKPST